jgi:drug/metabolite transporter (DMT)-like permease
MNWFFYSLLAVLCFSSYDILSRVFGLNAKNPRVFAIIYNAIVAAMALIIYFIFPSRPNHLSLFSIVIGVCGLFIWAIFGRLEYYAHKHVEASLLTIVTKIATVITFLASIVFLHEGITLQKIISVILIISANIIVLNPHKKKNMSEGILYAFLVALTLGIGWTIDKVASTAWGVSFYIFFSFLSPVVVNALIPVVKKQEIIVEVKNTSWLIFVLGTLNLFGYYALLMAFSVGEGSRVILVTSFSQILTILAGIIILKEKTHMLRKIIAGVMGILAIILLNS